MNFTTPLTLSHEVDLDFKTLSTVQRDNRKCSKAHWGRPNSWERTWVLRSYKLGLKRGQSLLVDLFCFFSHRTKEMGRVFLHRKNMSNSYNLENMAGSIEWRLELEQNGFRQGLSNTLPCLPQLQMLQRNRISPPSIACSQDSLVRVWPVKSNSELTEEGQANASFQMCTVG